MKRLSLYFLSLILFFASLPVPTVFAAVDGGLVKSSSNPAVYYIWQGKRYAFPNERIYFSWYTDFSSVQTISADALAAYPLAGNVTYRPGSVLMKVQADPRVYAVSRYGVLHWVASEQVAIALYGANWNTKVHDLSDAFFVGYRVEAPLESAAQYVVNTELHVNQISQNIAGTVVAVLPASASTMSAGCQVFPADNPWNQDISQLPVRADSATFMASIGLSRTLHPDFGENPDYGIPYTVVEGNQAKVPITFTAYGDESDPGPYPIPANAKVEAGGDRHVLVVDSGACKLYELYAAEKSASGSGWSADSGAVWNLNTGALRPQGWTSADAAGLPILPGLVRYDEVAAGEITHAIRFTASRTQAGMILPATHYARTGGSSDPPMGLRVRLKADYDISRLTGQARIIAVAMKKYGMILADNGSNWYFSGATDSRWNDDELNQLKSVPGSAFEAVDTGEIIH